jgi:CheY-like chemotaxis protein
VSAGKRRILLVEDNLETRELFAWVLEDNGDKVVCAEDGVGGLEAAKASVPDLVVTDIAMPRMDGVEMTRRLREYAPTSHVPIVAVTAHTSSAELERARKAGCNEVIEKPCLPDDLTSAVEHWVGGRRRRVRRDHSGQHPVPADRRVEDRRQRCRADREFRGVVMD